MICGTMEARNNSEEWELWGEILYGNMGEGLRDLYMGIGFRVWD